MTNVFSDILSFSEIIVEIQAFSGLHRSLNNKLFANSFQHSGNHLFSIILTTFLNLKHFRRRNGTEPRVLPGEEWSGVGEKCLGFKKVVKMIESSGRLVCAHAFNWNAYRHRKVHRFTIMLLARRRVHAKVCERSFQERIMVYRFSHKK